MQNISYYVWFRESIKKKEKNIEKMTFYYLFIIENDKENKI